MSARRSPQPSDMTHHIANPQVRILLYIALSMFLGGLVGVDREIAGKPAGLRTHILVAGAATLLVGLGNTIVQVALGLLAIESVLGPDPRRGDWDHQCQLPGRWDYSGSIQGSGGGAGDCGIHTSGGRSGRERSARSAPARRGRDLDHTDHTAGAGQDIQVDRGPQPSA